MKAKFKFCVRNDDTAFSGVDTAVAINGQTEVSHDGCSLVSEYFAAFFPSNILIMAGRGLGRRREYWCRQLGGLIQARWQFDAAHAAGLLVFLPARSREIASNNAFDGQRIGFPDQHRTPAE